MSKPEEIIIEAGNTRAPDFVDDAEAGKVREKLLQTILASFPEGMSVPPELALLAEAVRKYNAAIRRAAIEAANVLDEENKSLRKDLLQAALESFPTGMTVPPTLTKLAEAIAVYNESSVTRQGFFQVERAINKAWRAAMRGFTYRDALNEARRATNEAVEGALYRVAREINKG